jgi:hypothetical protein
MDINLAKSIQLFFEISNKNKVGEDLTSFCGFNDEIT